MVELKMAMTVVEIIIGALVAIALGDYLGHKLGVLPVAIVLGCIVLAVIVLFTIYAAVVLD